MDRHAIYFKLKPGCAEEYKRRHDEIWPEITAVLTEAGYRNYSIWNIGDMLFAYYETPDSVKLRNVATASQALNRWRDHMEDIIFIEPQTGIKEWDMELMFYHKS